MINQKFYGLENMKDMIKGLLYVILIFNLKDQKYEMINLIFIYKN